MAFFHHNANQIVPTKTCEIPNKIWLAGRIRTDLIWIGADDFLLKTLSLVGVFPLMKSDSNIQFLLTI